MPKGDRGWQEKTQDKLKDPKAPPIVLVVGYFLWRAISALSSVDFIFSIKNSGVAAVFQFVMSNGWWSIPTIAAVWLAIIWGRPMKSGAGPTWGIVGVLAVLAFLFGAMVTVYASSTAPPIVRSWGIGMSDGRRTCYIEADTSRLVNFREKFQVFMICGVNDSTVDMQEDDRIILSAPFSISGGVTRIEVRIAGKLDFIHSLPPGNGLTMWRNIVLLPRGTDPTRIKTLSDVPRFGGRVVESGCG